MKEWFAESWIPWALAGVAILIVIGVVQSNDGPTDHGEAFTSSADASMVIRAFHQRAGPEYRVAAPCSERAVRYQGEGIWHCGGWTYDEQTGDIYLTR